MVKKILYSILILLVIFFALLEIGNLQNGILKDKAIAIGYFSALTYTFAFGFLLRKKLQQILLKFNNQVILFTVIGSIGAFFIETVIWMAQTYLKTTGAAIHPNLFIDLIMTMPFYTLLSYFVAKWVIKSPFSWATIALAGGFYETAADGIVGNLVGLNILGALISPILIPLFIVMYSPIILVPFLLTKNTNQLIDPSKLKYKVLFKPLLALVIFPFSLGLGFLLASVLK